MSDGRIAVGVSGAGLQPAGAARGRRRGELGGEIVLVFADRACPGARLGRRAGDRHGAAGRGRRGRRRSPRRWQRRAPDVVVLAGYMRILGPAVLAAFAGRILNTHPSLLPAFPGAHAVRDALAHGVAVTGVTVHLVDATLDGGPIVAQEAVPVLPGDDEAALHERIQAVEHRLLPRAVALLAGGRGGARRPDTATSTSTRPTRASRRRVARCCPCRTRPASSTSGAGLVARGFELVSTGGTARALREAGLPVTDVAAVTGSPEMLDGRVKTLHPRVHGGLLADRRLDDHRAPAAGAGIAPFELVVVNLYPFAAALERPGITIDELIEEIDIGGPSMVRAAAKNHANVAIVTSPARYEAVLEALDGKAGLDDGSGVSWRSRRSPTPRPTTRGSRRSCRAGWWMPGLSRRARRRPLSADAHARPGEGRDAALRREPAPAGGALPAARARTRDDGLSGWSAPRCRARRSRTTTSWTRRRRRRSAGRCAARRASSSSTRTRVAPPSGRRWSRRGTRRSKRTRSAPSAAWWR